MRHPTHKARKRALEHWTRRGVAWILLITGLVCAGIPPGTAFYMTVAFELMSAGPKHRPVPAGVAVVLLGLTILTVTSAQTTNASDTEQTPPRWPTHGMQGFDCARPSSMIPIHPHEEMECPTTLPHIATRRNVTLTILQKAEYARVQGLRCEYTESRLPFFCGTYSHQTVVGDGVRIQEPKRITAEECSRMANKEEIYLGRARRDVPKNQRTQITYYHTGATIFSNSHHIDCVGGPFYRDYDRLTYYSITDLRVADIHVRDVTLAISDAEEVTEQRDRIVLPCKGSAGYCATASGTYTWSPPVTETDKCRLYRTREVRGELLTDENNERAFMSTDGTALHLLITGARWMCGREVMATNHETIFLSEDRTYAPFRRDIATAEMSAVVFGSAQVQYSERTVVNYMEESLLRLQWDRCQGEKARRGPLDQLAAGQAALANGETMTLGPGKFATARGEAFYQYSCAPVSATAETKEACYDALPVRISDEDRKAHFQARGEPYDPAVQFYVQPRTNLLTTDAAPMECLPHMPALYQNANGDWIAANPSIIQVQPPKKLSDPRTRAQILKTFKGTDYAMGGIYTPSQIRSMDQERQLPNRIHDIELTMAHRADYTHWQADNSGHRMVQEDVLSMSREWWVNPFDWIWARIQELGHLGSILVASSMIVKLCTWIAGVGMRFYYGRVGHEGSIRHLAQVLFPSAVLMFDRWEERRRNERRLRQGLLPGEGQELSLIHI